MLAEPPGAAPALAPPMGGWLPDPTTAAGTWGAWTASAPPVGAWAWDALATARSELRLAVDSVLADLEGLSPTLGPCGGRESPSTDDEARLRHAALSDTSCADETTRGADDFESLR